MTLLEVLAAMKVYDLADLLSLAFDLGKGTGNKGKGDEIVGLAQL